MTARLPSDFYETGTIADLPFDEKRFVVPWAMQVAQSGECYINMNATFEDSPGGTVEMGVMRTARGITVFLDGVDYSWAPTEELGEGVAGSKRYTSVSEIVYTSSNEE